MDNNPNNWTQIWHSEIEPHLRKLVGLFVIFFLFVLVYYIWFSFNAQNILALDPFLIGVGITLAFVEALFVWYFAYRRIRKFSGDEVGILIALTKLDAKVDPELVKLQATLERLIGVEGLSTKISLYVVPDEFVPKNEDSAHRLRKRLKAQLIIWGTVDHGNISSEPHTEFRPVHFSYELPLPSQPALIIKEGFDHVMANRKWLISEKENLLDRKYLAENMEEVSFHIISTVLFFANRLKESLEISTKTLKKYSQKESLTANEQIAISRMQSLLTALYRRETLPLALWSNSETKATDLLKAKELIVAMRETGHDVMASILESQVDFVEGNVTAAAEKLKTVYDTFPKESSVCFSLAFIYFHRGQLLSGWRWLSRAKTMRDGAIGRNAKDQILSIIRWYEERLHDMPSDQYLHFPLGVLNFYFLKDFQVAKASLERFLLLYENDRGLRSLIVECNQILKKIRKSHT